MFANITPRERIALLLMTLVIGVAVIAGGIVIPYQKAIAGLDSRVASRNEQVTQMNTMQQQILTLRQSSGLRQVADRGNFALLTTVEELIGRNAAKENLVYMRPQPSSNLEGLREEAVEIKIEKMPLEEIVRLLHAVESHRALLRIKNLRLKTRFDDKTLFDAVFAVATYERAA